MAVSAFYQNQGHWASVIIKASWPIAFIKAIPSPPPLFFFFVLLIFTFSYLLLFLTKAEQLSSGNRANTQQIRASQFSLKFSYQFHTSYNINLKAKTPHINNKPTTIHNFSKLSNMLLKTMKYIFISTYSKRIWKISHKSCRKLLTNIQ